MCKIEKTFGNPAKINLKESKAVAKKSEKDKNFKTIHFVIDILLLLIKIFRFFMEILIASSENEETVNGSTSRNRIKITASASCKTTSTVIKQDDKLLKTSSKSNKTKVRLQINKSDANDQQICSKTSTNFGSTQFTKESMALTSEKCSLTYNKDPSAPHEVNYSIKTTKVDKIQVETSQLSKIKVEIYRMESMHHSLTMQHPKEKLEETHFGPTRKHLEY